MLLRAENICKLYKKGKKSLEVLRDISLDIKEAEISVIIGPSGAGKSTLLHILGGLDLPSRGKVFFDNTDFYRLTDDERSLIRNRRIGFVFQFYNLLQEFSAIENVMMPGLISPLAGPGKKEVAAKAKELLCAVDLSNRISHRPGELSGGEAQRVAIARALMNNPDIVMCDEPTGNLDSENAKTVLKLIKDFNKRLKQTFLIVTHSDAVANIADNTIHIKDGKIE